MPILNEERARLLLRRQPFSRLPGTELLSCRDGQATLSLEIDARLLQQQDIAHGGVIAYLADNAAAFAAGTVLGEQDRHCHVERRLLTSRATGPTHRTCGGLVERPPPCPVSEHGGGCTQRRGAARMFALSRHVLGREGEV